jgi:hypothetical protein
MEIRPATNEEQARYWNGDEAAQWPVHEERYERMLAPFTDHLLTSTVPLPLPSPSRGRARCHPAASPPPCDQVGRRKSSAGGIALHLDLPNHGQLPKLCRRTR